MGGVPNHALLAHALLALALLALALLALALLALGLPRANGSIPKRFHTQKISSFVCVHSLLASACLASQLPKAMLVPAFAVDLAAVMCG